MQSAMHVDKLVSIIIPNYNGLGNLRNCLTSIRAHTDLSLNEVIVVDNASTDGSADFVRMNFPEVNVIVNKENLGNAEGCNVGFRHSRGRYLMILDNDTEVTEGWLTKLVTLAESDQQIGVCGSIPLWYEYRDIMPLYRGTFEASKVSGGVMFLRRELTERFGLFDPSYFAYYEDVDLCWRYVLRGYKVLYHRESIVLHKGGQTSKKMYPPFIVQHKTKNRLVTLAKVIDNRSLPRVVASEFLRIYLMLLTTVPKDKGKAFATVRAILWVVSNRNRIVAKRRALQSVRVASGATLERLIRSEREREEGVLFELLRRLDIAGVKGEKRDAIARRLRVIKFHRVLGVSLE